MDIKKVGADELVEFKSLEEFYKYIINTPLNDTFRWEKLSSVFNDYDFTQTNSFDEAIELFKNGWQEMSETLTQRLKIDGGQMEKVMVSKSTLSVQGYQPVVPLFLNGIPNNMISRKMQPMKQKVITVNKVIVYNCGVKIDEIVEESIKALMIIKKLENQNYRCNLNIVVGVRNMFKSVGYIVKIRIKSANERLNINKLSFPLVHPSMLRRLFFRFMEVHPGVPEVFRVNYGFPLGPNDFRELYPNEILLPQFIRKDIRQINTLKDLEIL